MKSKSVRRKEKVKRVEEKKILIPFPRNTKPFLIALMYPQSAAEKKAQLFLEDCGMLEGKAVNNQWNELMS